MQQGLPWKHGIALDTQQLTRLTLSTEDSSAAAQAFTGAHAAASSFDLLAVQPMSERVLQQVWKPCYLPATLQYAARHAAIVLSKNFVVMEQATHACVVIQMPYRTDTDDELTCFRHALRLRWTS